MPYYAAECVDPQTGRSFFLRMPGQSAEAARRIANDWDFIVTKPEQVRLRPIDAGSSLRTVRGGKSAPAGDAFRAATSEDMDAMLAALDEDCHLVDRHFLLQRLASRAYRENRIQDDPKRICEAICWQWLLESKLLITALRREFDNRLPRIEPPLRLVWILRSEGFLERATRVAVGSCNLGLNERDTMALEDEIEEMNGAAGHDLD